LPPRNRGADNIPSFTQASTVRSQAQMLAHKVEMSCHGGHSGTPESAFTVCVLSSDADGNGLDHEAELVLNPLEHTISGDAKEKRQRKNAKGKTPKEKRHEYVFAGCLAWQLIATSLTALVMVAAATFAAVAGF
jgi:hypothetical protein